MRGVSVLLLAGVVGLTSCVALEQRHPRVVVTGKKPGPPPWAPAHGHRAKRVYHYYPTVGVYFDVRQQVYFFLDGGTWRVAATLPTGIVIQPAEHVVLELEADRPYVYYEQHRAKYPPGLFKNKKHGKHGKRGKRGKSW